MNEKEDSLLETASKIVGMVTNWAKKSVAPKSSAQKRWEAEMNKISALNGRDSFYDPVPPAKKTNNAQAWGNVSINGKLYNGEVVGIKNGRVMVNGIDVSDGYGDSKTITIDISGDVKMLAVDACEYVKVNGNAGKVETMSGDVTCGDVTGDVKTMSGTVTCGDIAGSVETMSGNVRRK